MAGRGLPCATGCQSTDRETHRGRRPRTRGDSRRRRVPQRPHPAERPGTTARSPHPRSRRPVSLTTGQPMATHATRFIVEIHQHRVRRGANIDPASPVDWLDYTQWTCWPHGSPEIGRTQPVPILDHDAYNQSLSRGNLHPIADIMLVCQLQLSGPGKCILRLICRADKFEWELSSATNECRLWWNGDSVARAFRPSRPPPWRVEMAVCDHRVLAALDGAMVFEFDCEPSVGRTAEDQPRLSVGASGAIVRFDGPASLPGRVLLGTRRSAMLAGTTIDRGRSMVRAGGQRAGLSR